MDGDERGRGSATSSSLSPGTVDVVERRRPAVVFEQKVGQPADRFEGAHTGGEPWYRRFMGAVLHVVVCTGGSGARARSGDAFVPLRKGLEVEDVVLGVGLKRRGSTGSWLCA